MSSYRVFVFHIETDAAVNPESAVREAADLLAGSLMHECDAAGDESPGFFSLDVTEGETTVAAYEYEGERKA